MRVLTQWNARSTMRSTGSQTPRPRFDHTSTTLSGVSYYCGCSRYNIRCRGRRRSEGGRLNARKSFRHSINNPVESALWCKGAPIFQRTTWFWLAFLISPRSLPFLLPLFSCLSCLVHTSRLSLVHSVGRCPHAYYIYEYECGCFPFHSCAPCWYVNTLRACVLKVLCRSSTSTRLLILRRSVG